MRHKVLPLNCFRANQDAHVMQQGATA